MEMNLKAYENALSSEAQDLLKKMLPKYYAKQDAIKKIPVAVLIWGPSPSAKSKISEVRLKLRESLRLEGHLAMFSEELSSHDCELSLRAQELIQAEEFDVILSIPEAQGSIAEIHDFTNDTRVNRKIIVFLNKSYNGGYSNQSLFTISCVLGCEVVFYENEDDTDIIIDKSIEEIRKVREFKYFFSGRM